MLLSGWQSDGVEGAAAGVVVESGGAWAGAELATTLGEPTGEPLGEPTAEPFATPLLAAPNSAVLTATTNPGIAVTIVTYPSRADYSLRDPC